MTKMRAASSSSSSTSPASSPTRNDHGDNSHHYNKPSSARNGNAKQKSRDLPKASEPQSPAQRAQSTEMEDDSDQDELNNGESANESVSPISTGRKTPFRSFKPRSKQSIALLNAMLRCSPFDKANGSSVHDRWQGVINILIQAGEQQVEVGGKNAYLNVIPRTCQLAWDRFKEDYTRAIESHSSERLGMTRDGWNNLVHQVLELEQAGKVRKKKGAKRSNMDDENNGTQLDDDAFASRLGRRLFSDTDMSVNYDDHPQSSRLRLDDSALLHQIQKQVSELVRYAKEKSEDSSRRQEYRDKVLIDTLASTQQKFLQAMNNLVAKQEAASERQATAIEALTAALLRKK
ncbi:hypothetical protein BGZ80_004754 [Entomortierella chlamydospora]|uniref:Uncharacterized protein n=1 Tax=Entomortierella chlamydospora TaxID=101097 RepID=A0A9P6MLV9_9FUNG|nr:hypothetical protein BGZ79_001391 [Entomortierella chlamydospora]KAG0007356.1 hypothetical protein BGZ80_004754 [Entomortierella chlamydospora]